MPDDRAPVLVLANPRSGGGLAGELVPHLARDLGELGYPVEVFQSSAPGQITQRVRAAGGSWSALAVVGGDGTVREVLQGDPGPDRPIAVLPAGTANVLAADFRLPKAPRETAAMIAAGHSRLVDCGEMTRDRETQRFLLFVGAGADARIVHSVHARRAGGTLGKLSYVVPILGVLKSYRPTAHWLVLENGDRHGPFQQVLVTNVRSYGGMWKLPEGIACDDGLLDGLGFRAETAGRLFRHGVRGVLNRLRESDDLVRVQAARLRIEADGESPVQVDGDPGGHCPVEIEVKPNAVRLSVPSKDGA